MHGLSAYEFAKHFYIRAAKYPFSLAAADADPDGYETALTETGREKLADKGRKVLTAGKDYAIREAGGQDWLPLGHGNLMKDYRHNWVIKARNRPYVPVIFGAGSSKTEEDQAMRILVLFFPWVNDAQDASERVPFINDLRTSSMTSWKEALLHHATSVGFATQELKQLVMSFVFTYCLPRQACLADGLEENSDNEGIVDELVDLHLDEKDLLEATLTHVRGSGRGDSEDEGNTQSDAGGDEAGETTRLYDRTMDMFRLSGNIWLQGKGHGEAEAKARVDALQRGAGGAGIDHDRARQAAKESRNNVSKEGAGKNGLLGTAAPHIEAGA